MACREMDCTWQLGSCWWRKPASTTGRYPVVFPFESLVLAQQAPFQLANISALLGQGHLLLLQLLCLHACTMSVFLPFACPCCRRHHLTNMHIVAATAAGYHHLAAASSPACSSEDTDSSL